MNAVEMVNVFCHRGGGGNPTGLALDASRITDDQMRGVAEACGHESGFILPPSGGSPAADFRFRYFVPRHEMEMCGHATVGALWLLRDKGRIDPGTYRIETLSGPVTGYVGETIEITQPRGTVAAADEFRDDILDVLRLDSTALADRPIQNAHTSRVKTLVPVRDADTLNAIQPDFPRVEALCDALGSTGLYPYAVISESDGTFEARQFPRASGYPEDADGARLRPAGERSRCAARTALADLPGPRHGAAVRNPGAVRQGARRDDRSLPSGGRGHARRLGQIPREPTRFAMTFFLEFTAPGHSGRLESNEKRSRAR
jgi:PhzF family phenazine biosynthesis protein